MSGILDRYELKLNLLYTLTQIDNTKFKWNFSKSAEIEHSDRQDYSETLHVAT